MNIIAYDIKKKAPFNPERKPTDGEYALFIEGKNRTIKQYFPEPQKQESNQVKLISMGEIINSLPLGTKRKITAISNIDDINGDIADLLLMFLAVGDPINVNGDEFKKYAGWLISQNIGITTDHIDKIIGL